jgi:hypothetical protein
LISRDASRVQWTYAPSAGRADRGAVLAEPWLSSRHSFMNRWSTWVKDPVSCALMSGLSRDRCHRPSWVYACVSGTNLSDVLEAQRCYRYCLNCT